MNHASLNPRSLLNCAADELERQALLRLIAAMTLALCVFFGFQQTPFRIVAQLSLLVVLLNPKVLERFELWLGIAVVATGVLASNWSGEDNHKYLLVYWLWVMAFATYVNTGGLADAILRSHARFFVVFVFLVAAFQKIFSPTYMSGEMFELKLLLDDRFKAFAHMVGIDRSVAEKAGFEFLALQSPIAVFDNDSRTITSNSYVRQVALLITWYDLIIQFAIGLLFVPARKITDLIGHLCLLFFIYTTYIAAPVFGFGWTLSIYGMALTHGRHRWLALLYAGALIAVLLYQTPWRNWILDI